MHVCAIDIFNWRIFTKRYIIKKKKKTVTSQSKTAINKKLIVCYVWI